MKKKMKISLIPNDFTQDIELVFQLCNKEKVQYVELASMWGKSILDLTEEEEKRLLELMDKYHLKTASIQTQIMKTMAPTSKFNKLKSNAMHLDHDYNIKQIDRAIELANTFKTPYIISYTYFRRGTTVSEANWEKLFEDYQTFLPKIQQQNKIMVVECEPDTFAGSIEEYLRLFTHLNSPHIRANFDFANLLGAQKQFSREEFERFRPYVNYFHVKDRKFRRILGSTGAIFGEGNVPWKQTLSWFAETDFDGFLSVEPHVHGQDRIEKGRKCVQNLQKLLTELKIPFE
jgi:sugar phosphate isomerase/epimerase